MPSPLRRACDVVLGMQQVLGVDRREGPAHGVSSRRVGSGAGPLDEPGEDRIGARLASSSGCHCTAMTSWPGHSSASTVPSVLRATTSHPGATRSTVWWCSELTVWSGAVHLVQAAARLDDDLVDALGRRHVVAGVLGHVLVQGAAAPHVEQLQAAADAEHRDALVDGDVDEAELGPIAVRFGWVDVGSGSAPYRLGLDVRATRQQQAVETAGVLGGVDVLGQVHRQAARRGDGPGVVTHVHVDVEVAEAAREPGDLGAELAPAGQADERT